MSPKQKCKFKLKWDLYMHTSNKLKLKRLATSEVEDAMEHEN